MKHVFIAWHQGPCGESILGIFTKHSSARKCKDKWDKEHTHDWDKAVITRHKVR